MIKNIIFDWSGVVKDATSLQLGVVNNMFKKFGAREISIEEFKESWQQPYMLFYNKYLPKMTIEEEQSAYREFMSEYLKSEPIPGIVDLIKEFKKENIKMVVLSSDFPDTLLQEVKEYGLEGIFDEIITNCYDKVESIIDFVKKNSFAFSETIIIGDSNHEIETGKKAGIITGAVTWGFNNEEKLRADNPDFVIHNMKEFRKIILSS